MAFVLFTRAIRELILSYAMTREGRPAGPSRFIAEALSQPGEQHEAGERRTAAAVA